MICDQVDELAAAYAVGAVEPTEEREISQHLSTCDRPHVEARQLIDAAAAVPAQLDPMLPGPALRARLLATVAETAQDHRPAPAPRRLVEAPPAERHRWWQRSSPMLGLAAAGALALAVGLGAWGVSLQQQVADRDTALRAVATADAAHRVTGSAGSGWLLETDDETVFLAEGLAALDGGRIYELWLIEADGGAVAVGVVNEVEDLVIAPLESQVGDATAFAVTVEAERVDAPTSDPVLIATLEG
jgi:anti-sigma-K factor RskA